MDKSEYKNQYILEKNYWWFKGQREIFLKLIDIYLKKKKKNYVLDAGCGAGYNSIKLKQYGKVLSIDYSNYAIQLAKKRGVKNIKRMNLNKISIKKKFDLILCSGVLYHKDIKINAVLKSFSKLLKKDGIVVITTPAIKILQNKIFLTGHDKTMHTGNRYYLNEISKKLERNNLSILKKSYFTSFLLFPIIIFRLLSNTKNLFIKNKVESNLFDLPKIINSFFSFLMSIEKQIIAKSSLPIGLHLVIVAKK